MLDINPIEALAVGSVENFLTADERRKLIVLMDARLVPEVRQAADAHRTNSIHEIPGASAEYARKVYEPAGRVELTILPNEVIQILKEASTRALPLVRSYAPSVMFAREWTYVEYGIGQFITCHVDRVAPSPTSRPLQLLGVSVCLNDDILGGEFYVETTPSPELWSEEFLGRLRFARKSPDISADWFNRIPRTRWTVRPRAGDALVYGAHVAHGTLPVQEGCLRKFISWYACT